MLHNIYVRVVIIFTYTHSLELFSGARIPRCLRLTTCRLSGDSFLRKPHSSFPSSLNKSMVIHSFKLLLLSVHYICFWSNKEFLEREKISMSVKFCLSSLHVIWEKLSIDIFINFSVKYKTFSFMESITKHECW